MKLRTIDEPKTRYSFARRVFKCDFNALLEVFLNIAVVLVLVISVTAF